MKKIISVLGAFFICASTMFGCGNVRNEESVPIVPEPTSESQTTTESESATATSVTTTETEVTTTVTETTPDNSKSEALTRIQENSIAWLNYLAMLSQEINESQHSKMFLEEAYASIIDNSNPENVNTKTETYLMDLLDIIERYRIIDTKRERLQYLYEQNKARAFRQAMPNPTALLSASVTLNPKALIGSVLYMAVDSVNSYNNYNDELDMQYLKDGWDLDDKAAENVHDNRKFAFKYMIETVRDFNLPGDLALSEKNIEEFVKCKNNDNIHQQLQFLEANENTYQAFGSYWLLRAECYFKNDDYRKCLNCIDRYENLNADIFRKDYYLARTLPFAIASAYEVLPKDKYIETADRYLKLMLQNLDNDEWSLRYYAAEMYTLLYTQTNRKSFLQSSYDLLLNNVNHLVGEQNILNAGYLGDVKKEPIPDGTTKKDKKRIEEYNESLEDKRKTELPTVYEPLAVNCELLFSVAEKLDISSSERQKIENILTKDGSSVFWTIPIQNHFSFNSGSQPQIDAEYEEDKLILPVSCVSEGTIIKTTVTSGDQINVYEDWEVDKVKRSENDFNSYRVIYESDEADDCKWHEDSLVSVEITTTAVDNCKPIILTFKVKSIPSWYNIFSSVTFEQVD